jgi:hypothetical protein
MLAGMTALVADGVLGANPNNAAARVALEQIRDFIAEMTGGSAIEALTLASDTVTPTVAVFSVDTEGAAAEDDLATIAQTNHPAGRLIAVRSVDAARVVTIVQGGNILTRDAQSIVLYDPKDFVLFLRVGAAWVEVFRSIPNRLRRVRALDAATALVASDSGATLTNTGASGDLEHDLPAATVGMELRVRVTAAHKIKLTADGSDTITDDDGTTVSAGGGNTEIAAVVGNLFDIECFEAGKWVVTRTRGTLTTT